MLSLKVTAGKDSCGLVLSEEAMARLGVKDGDTLYLTEQPDGSCRLAPDDPDFVRQMALAEKIMRDDREILRALAK